LAPGGNLHSQGAQSYDFLIYSYNSSIVAG
jgi:hypothetical protein